MRIIKKSNKLNEVLYDVRGPALDEANRLEEEGFHITKLNIGNPPHFGFDAPDEILHDVIINLNQAQGYSDSKGLFSARKAIMQHCQQRNIADVQVEDIYLGNGVSELIVMSIQGLINRGHEILIPAPDYPLWTAAVNLAGGKPVHYLCDEKSDWVPDLKDIEKKITSKTKGIVIINPNNPTGAVYPKGILERIVKIAERNQLILFSDEIYDKVLFDDAEHLSIASLADDILFVTFNGLSKAYRIPGFRAGWMILSGNKKIAKDYIEGLDMLASIRLCGNVPGQLAIQTSLGGYQSIKDLVLPGGRLRKQRDIAYQGIVKIPGVSCVKPKAGFYLFPKLDQRKFSIKSDEKFILDLLLETKILVVQGTGFHWPNPDHFRIVFLPRAEELKSAIKNIGRFLGGYKQ